VLSKTLDYLLTTPDSHELLEHLVDRPDSLRCSKSLEDHISALLEEARELPRPIELTRGRATVPLKGIDVPFHSTYLRPGVHSYRKFLESRMVHEDLMPERLVGKFVPNLMASPFSLDRAYVEEAFRLTGSPVLQGILGSDPSY
jgi:fatty acid synthase subunit beta